MKRTILHFVILACAVMALSSCFPYREIAGKGPGKEYPRGHGGVRDDNSFRYPTSRREIRKFESGPVPYAIVETKPMFMGKDPKISFIRWVDKNLKYPRTAKARRIQGRTTLEITVSKNGKVKDVKVLRSSHRLLDEEAVRVVSNSPRWMPGKQNGKAVDVKYVFSVTFNLP